MCSDFTLARKALHGMTQNVRKEYGGSGGVKKKIKAATGRKVKFVC